MLEKNKVIIFKLWIYMKIKVWNFCLRKNKLLKELDSFCNLWEIVIMRDIRNIGVR